ncbi:TRAP transporter small permease [Oricola sp.]|uniref:TRAP transporter small permease n=1 Tax=Oricola sp. TaxID=1979950 RepID=UPI0025F140FA|nr:TRAP transporter small permease [Oricola sp.]MCI5074144.1 TRAP transporter small permease [Oricola sp.]
MRKATDRILSAIEIAGMSLALLTLFLIMISITADAFGRYFLHTPITGQYEFTALYLMVIMTFMGLARTQALGGHIAISIMAPTLNKLPFRIAARLTSLLCLIAFGLMTWLTGEEALSRIAARTTTFGAVQFPTYLSYCWVPIGVGILSLRLLHQTIWPVAYEGQSADYE